MSEPAKAVATQIPNAYIFDPSTLVREPPLETPLPALLIGLAATGMFWQYTLQSSFFVQACLKQKPNRRRSEAQTVAAFVCMEGYTNSLHSAVRQCISQLRSTRGRSADLRPPLHLTSRNDPTTPSNLKRGKILIVCAKEIRLAGNYYLPVVRNRALIRSIQW